MKISKINLYEVIVPAKKGTVDSLEINKPLHKLSVGADEGWSIQFDKLSKILISIELSNGIVGWGECYRGNLMSDVKEIATKVYWNRYRKNYKTKITHSLHQNI